MRSQLTVMEAVTCREAGARPIPGSGRENLGFAWMYRDFLIFAMRVILMWHIRGRYEHGLLVRSCGRLSAYSAVSPQPRPTAAASLARPHRNLAVATKIQPDSHRSRSRI
jgi:hypothetical protein